MQLNGPLIVPHSERRMIAVDVNMFTAIQCVINDLKHHFATHSLDCDLCYLGLVSQIFLCELCSYCCFVNVCCFCDTSIEAIAKTQPYLLHIFYLYNIQSIAGGADGAGMFASGAIDSRGSASLCGASGGGRACTASSSSIGFSNATVVTEAGVATIGIWYRKNKVYCE
jgi:hypothetical protein